MGQEIRTADFADGAAREFQKRLRDETATLKRWFDERLFDYAETPMTGLELEAWLLDQNHMPAPENEAFIRAADDPDIVEELSKFNFELNAPPRPLGPGCFSDTEHDLAQTWAKCESTAKHLGLKACAIGTLPTVRDEMLQPEWMSNANRYKALNDEVFEHRAGKPLHIAIHGEESLDYHAQHIMLEAACTSLQVHLKVNQEEAPRFYNAAVLAAAPLVGACANSPFLYGKSLWHETRIPAFEQATAITGHRDSKGRNALRVTLGSGYVRHSFMELFLENMSYAPLLPSLVEDRSHLPHLKLQNGTIWRWVRPILGFDGLGTPHLRIEHRVMPAGPSVRDTMANIALCHGLMFALARQDITPETATPFEDARANFYAAAKDGLRATVRWQKKSINLQTLLLDHLLPMARKALAAEGVDADDLDYCFNHVLYPRIRSGQTGSQWQRRCFELKGRNTQALVEIYLANQQSGEPVHLWTC